MRTNKALIMRVVQSTFVTREACRRTAHVGYARRARPHDDCTLRNSRVLHVNMCFTTAASAAKLDNTTRPITICIEGNISAGKSTFLQEVLKFSDHHMRGNVCLVPEPVHLWQSVERASDRTSTINVLDEFYKDPSGLAYKFQHYVFMTRFIEETRSRQGNFDLRVMERSVFSDKNVFTAALYENGWLSDLDLSLYHAWYSPMLEEFPSLTPDGFVYLRASPTTCLRRLKKRARGEETGVDATYLTSLHSKHESWLLPEDAVTVIQRSLATVNEVKMDCGGNMKTVPVLVLNCDDDTDMATDVAIKKKLQDAIVAFYTYLQHRNMCDTL